MTGQFIPMFWGREWSSFVLFFRVRLDMRRPTNGLTFTVSSLEVTHPRLQWNSIGDYREPIAIAKLAHVHANKCKAK